MAGAGYKLFNTGDVLTAAQVNTYLMEQTVMVFADAAARTTALSGVVSEGMISYLKDTNAVEVYNGSAWVASDDPNAIQNTIVDAKGDLISATADNVPARLAVGNNGETLVANSSASVGLSYQEPKAGNPVINSAFQVWQRGTSIALANTSSNYTADRWAGISATTGTISRQTTSDTTNLPNIQYCARAQRTNGQTGTGAINLAQFFESVNSIPFAGKQVTLSFYARAGANYSSASNALGANLYTGTGTDQNPFAVSYTGSANPISGTATLTTTWQRFTYSGTLASTATELYINFSYTPSGTAGAADYFEVTGVQLEVGSVASPFKTQGVTLAGEFQACARYYWATPTKFLRGFGTAQAYSTTAAISWFGMPTVMRTAPSLSVSAVGDFELLNTTGSSVAVTGITLGDATAEGFNLYWTVASGLTAGSAAFIRDDNNQLAQIRASAEL